MLGTAVVTWTPERREFNRGERPNRTPFLDLSNRVLHLSRGFRRHRDKLGILCTILNWKVPKMKTVHEYISVKSECRVTMGFDLDVLPFLFLHLFIRNIPPSVEGRDGNKGGQVFL